MSDFAREKKKEENLLGVEKGNLKNGEP